MTGRVLGSAAAVLAVLAAAGIAATRPFGYDLAAYVAAARRLLAGGELYPLAARETIFLGAGEYLYPPTSAVGFVPLALLPADVATAVWTAVLVIVAAATAWELISPLDERVRPWALAAYALYLPLIAEITLGNLNLVTLGLCLLAWRLRSASAAGATLALAVGSKLLPIGLPLFFVGAAAWRTLAYFAVVAVGVFVATLPFLAGEWRTYAELIVEIGRAPAAQATSLVPTAIQGARLLLVGAAAAVIFAAGRLSRDDRRASLAYATALAALPLAAPGIWYPYLVFALPLLAATLRGSGPWGVAVAIAAFAALEVPKQPDGPDVAFYGLVALIVAGLARAVRTRPAPRSTAP